MLNRIETSKRHCTTGSHGPLIFDVNSKAALGTMEDEPKPEVELIAATQPDSNQDVACPNRWNIYHECTDYCRQRWGNQGRSTSEDVACPNRWNIYHECTDYCRQRWGNQGRSTSEVAGCAPRPLSYQEMIYTMDTNNQAAALYYAKVPTAPEMLEPTAEVMYHPMQDKDGCHLREETGYAVGPDPYQQDKVEHKCSNESVHLYSTAMPAAPPPTYDSLFGKMKTAKSELKGDIECCKKLSSILSSTIAWVIFLMLSMGVPVIMIVVGVIHKDDCPVESWLPIYLIVGGCFCIVKNLVILKEKCSRKKDKDPSDDEDVNLCSLLINCFLLAWFIAGNVWVYRTNGEWSDYRGADNYCDPLTFWLSFWVVTATYIIFGCICSSICCGAVIMACVLD